MPTLPSVNEKNRRLPLPSGRLFAIIIFCIALFSLLFFRPTVPTVHAGEGDSLKTEHAKAISLAREGKTGEGVEILQRLHRQWASDNSITEDLIVVSGWDGQYRYAAQLFEEKNSSAYPVYVRYAMVDVYRNLQQPALGLKLLDGLLEQEPANKQYLLRKSLLLIDQGKNIQAEEILKGLVHSINEKKDLYLASAYLHESKQQWFATLNDYEDALLFSPEDQIVLRKQMLTLNHLRAATIAAEKNSSIPNMLPPQEWATILTGRAAELLRWSSDANRDHSETITLSLQALALQLEALSFLNDNTADKTSRRQILLDIVITLRNLRQMEELQSVYALLLEDGPVPEYVQQAMADSLLATRHPDKAQEIYRQLVQNNSKNHQAHLGLFYSYIEDENFSSAYKTIDSLTIHEPRFLSFWDSKTRYPNDRYLDLQVTAIQARFYGDQLDEAWERINTLVDNAPKNNWLLEVRGQVSSARDWPRQALADFHLAGLLAPDSLNATAGKTASLIELQRYEEARPHLLHLHNAFPYEHATKDLEKQWDYSRRPAYWSDIVLSNSSGPELNGDGMLASVETVSQPIYDIWKLSAGYRYAWSELIEGTETFKRTSVGLAYDKGDWNILGTVHYNDSTLKETGGMLKVIWQPDDHWNISLSGERFSANTPLRALYYGIRADAANTSITYRLSEMRDVAATLQFSNFTDDNDRLEGGFRIRQRFVDIPHLDIDGRIDLYSSTNSKTDVPYYSPVHDLSMKGSIHADHVYYRNYDHLLAQQLDMGYGFYDQDGYVPRWIGHIRYEHRYRFSPWLEILLGGEIGQNVYDGHAEPYRLARLMINGKF